MPKLTYLADIFFLLGDERRKLPIILVTFLLVSILDLVSISLVGGYVTLLTQPAESLPDLARTALRWLGVDQGELPILGFGLFLIGIFLVKAVVAISVQRVILAFSMSQMALLRTRAIHAIQQMPYATFVRRNSAEYVNAVVHYVGQYTGSLRYILSLVSEGLVAIAIFALLTAISGMALALLLLVGLVLVVGFDKIFRHRLPRAGKLSNEGNQLVIRAINEWAAGFKEIRVLGREQYFFDQVSDGSWQVARANTFTQLVGAIPRYLVEVAIIVFVVLLVGLNVAQGNSLQSIYPTIGMMGVAALRLGPIVSLVITSFVSLRTNRPGITLLRREFDHLAKSGEESLMHRKGNDQKPFKELVLREVSFSYAEESRPALKNISLSLISGESIGLVGPSGSGKTTLVDIILGFLEHQRGEISLNNQPLRDHLQSWRAQIAYLPQEIFLIDDTIRENISLVGKGKEVDTYRLQLALSQARLADFVKELPDGLDTILGENGIRLSGGQRQRIALARAFYHQREVLIMDEATSALDTKTEREIVDEIHQLKGDVTMIVIAHRLTTLQHCDRVYRLDKGRIVEVGSYEEVTGKIY